MAGWFTACYFAFSDFLFSISSGAFPPELFPVSLQMSSREYLGHVIVDLSHKPTTDFCVFALGFFESLLASCHGMA